MKLLEIVSEMEEAMDKYDLPDNYLKAHDCLTRRIGEFQYGISFVPCEWVYPYLEALITDERLLDIVKEIDEEE